MGWRMGMGGLVGDDIIKSARLRGVLSWRLGIGGVWTSEASCHGHSHGHRWGEL